jgi:NADH:ubiquinone oxidoreductase subunit 2 (subunit N)
MNFVWTHSKKNDVLSIIKKFFKLTFTRYEQIVRFIRIDDEQILSIEYNNFMKMRKINTKRIVSYTSIQNEKIKQFEEILIMKSRGFRI